MINKTIHNQDKPYVMKELLMCNYMLSMRSTAFCRNPREWKDEARAIMRVAAERGQVVGLGVSGKRRGASATFPAAGARNSPPKFRLPECFLPPLSPRDERSSW